MFDSFFEKNIVKESCNSKKKVTESKKSCPKCKANPCKCGKVIEETKKTCKLCKSDPCKCEASLLSKGASKIKSATANVKKRLDVRKALKEALVGEVLFHILDESLGIQLDNSTTYNVMKRNLVESFVLEKGAQNIMDKMKDISPALYEAQNICEEYLDKMITFVNEDEYFIDKDEKSNFYTDLKSLNIDDITDLIKARVSTSIDDFVQSNATLKAEIEDIVNNSKQKIDASTSDAMKESYEKFSTRAINQLKDNKVKNVYESMFINIANAAMINENMTSYIKEDGKLDNYKIHNNVKVMYSFLEMLNTTRLENIDDKYIIDIVKNLK